jgi:hypothetical protein
MPVPLTTIYNPSNQNINLIVRKIDRRFASSESDVPYNISKIVTLYAGNKIRIESSRIEPTEITRLKSLFNVNVGNALAPLNEEIQVLEYGFDGSYYLQRDDPSGIPIGNNSRSMFGWVRPKNVNNLQSLFGYGPVGVDRSKDHNLLTYNWDKRRDIEFYGADIEFNPSTVVNGVETNSLTHDTWNFVGMSYSDSNLTLYVNDYSWSTTIDNLDTTADTIRIAQGLFKNSTDNNIFVGDLSSVSIFDRAVDSGYVSSLKEAGRVTYDDLPGNLKYVGGYSSNRAKSSNTTYISGGLQAAIVEMSNSTLQTKNCGTVSNLSITNKEFLLSNITTIDQNIEVFYDGSVNVLVSSSYSGLPDSLLSVRVKGIAINSLETSQGILDVRVVDGVQINDISISDGNYLEFKDSNYIGPVSYWDLTESNGVRYDSVSNNDLAAVAI